VASCIALGAISMYVVLEAQLVDAKIKSGTAESLAQANEARSNARVALKEVETLCLSLQAGDIKNVQCH